MSAMIKVLLIYGGKSGEHEVSLCSAASVLANLSSETYEVTALAIDKDGRLYVHEGARLSHYKDKLPVKTLECRELPSLLHQGKLALDVDIVFPVIHGPLYEDGCLQGLLKMANVAFVGAGVLSSALGMDKDIARRLVQQRGLSCARYQSISSFSSIEAKEAFCRQVAKAFGWPLFVKPCSLGSSVGIQKVSNHTALLAAVSDAARYDEQVLVEEFIKGREIELAVLEKEGSDEPSVSIAGEIKVNSPDGFYSYTAKYLQAEQTELIVPAVLNDKLLLRLQKASADIFSTLKCKGMARVDFFVDEDERIIFNEINTIPGFTIWSMYPKMWQASGLAYGQLLDSLIKQGLKYHQLKQNIVTNYL